MAIAHATKGVLKSGAATTAKTTPAAPTPSVFLPGSPAEMQVTSQSTRTWDDTKQLRKAWDVNTARAEFQYASNMIGAPASWAALMPSLMAITAELTDITVSFEGPGTQYSWGSMLGFVNASPCSHYMQGTQTNANIVPRGSSWVATGVAPGASTWGFVVMKVLDIGYSRRFGGSFCVVLEPSEDCAIELYDAAKSLAVDLHQWVLRLYVRPSASLFNATVIQSGGVLPLLACEIDVIESEAYQMNASGSLSSSTTATQADVDALLRQAEADAIPRLEKLARFVMGWVHQSNIPNFNRTSERVDRIHVSDGDCHFELSNKTATIDVQVKIGYLFLSEGLFDNERELTAEPYVQLRTPPIAVLNRRKEKYIGNAQGTGWLTMGYITPAELATVHEVVVFPGWTESDPGPDDEGGASAAVFNVNFDATAIEQRVVNVQPGVVGQEIFGLMNDAFLDWTSYSIQVRFLLTWR